MKTRVRPALREIIERLFELDEPTRADVNRIKLEVSRKHGLHEIPGNSELIKLLESDERVKLISILMRKRTRYLSGVNVVAVMTEPRPCPHGRCAYCPGGPDEGSPQSYTGHEPAAMRGIQNDYDPHDQVKNRMEQLRAIGHRVDKVDLIVMGGTFPAAPREYQKNFIRGCLDAITGKASVSLEDAKNYAEDSDVRNVGITVETRPDCVTLGDVDSILELGVTRVEVGVQNLYDDIYEMVGRGHSVQDVVDATRILKDSSLKVCYHMMPGLPSSSPKRDLDAFKALFQDARFKPDMLKIYPTVVVKGTRLHEWWRRGEYSPMTTEETVELLARAKKLIPPWVRVMRIQRDIPVHQVEAGVDKGNIRQLIKEKMLERGDRCRCIRCREVGHRRREGVEADPDRLELIHRSYNASGGTEEFISVEDVEADVLVGFLRLRIPGEPHRPEISQGSGLIRELHIYGRMTPVGEVLRDAWQHRGWGEALMEEAERTARERYGLDKLVVMSALGTRAYYIELGYVRDGIYVSKMLC